VVSDLEQTERADDAGWVRLDTVGAAIAAVEPDFDTRTHGFRKLSDLIKAHTAHFETRLEKTMCALSVRTRKSTTEAGRSRRSTGDDEP